jgi:cytoskeletal protein RodZ
MKNGIGDLLREAREARGHSLEDVEKATRIRAKYLEALESGDFGVLPSATQARGFLRNYAQFLGLDAEAVLARYGEAVNKKSFLSLAAPRPKPVEVAHGERPTLARARRPRLLSPDLLIAAVVTLGLGSLLLWGGVQLAAGLAATPTGTRAPATATPGAGTSAPRPDTPTPLPVAASPTVPLPTPLPNYSGVNLIVRAEQRTWLSVKVDGVEVFAGLMVAGASKEFVGQQVVEVTTGNGLGTHVIWNGRDQGTLGEIGEVVVRLWTLEGMITPTPTITPIPSKTPRVSETP